MDSLEGIKLLPISLHKYNFANVNPINNSDPSGYGAIGTLGDVVAAETIEGIEAVEDISATEKVLQEIEGTANISKPAPLVNIVPDVQTIEDEEQGIIFRKGDTSPSNNKIRDTDLGENGGLSYLTTIHDYRIPIGSDYYGIDKNALVLNSKGELNAYPDTDIGNPKSINHMLVRPSTPEELYEWYINPKGEKAKFYLQAIKLSKFRQGTRAF